MRWLSRRPCGVGSVDAPLAWGGGEERLRDAGDGMPGCPLRSGPPVPAAGGVSCIPAPRGPRSTQTQALARAPLLLYLKTTDYKGGVCWSKDVTSSLAWTVRSL